MIFGIPISANLLLVLGLTLFALLVFQLLVGLRKIKFGRKTWVYHRWAGYALVGLAVVHGFLGILHAYGFVLF